jgi:pimeloyl-ACP methyl ester carboxylesterase
MNNIAAPDFSRVNYVSQGEGAPVLCIHGLAASLYDWNDLLPALANAGFAAYALDLLGHGKSYKPTKMEDYSADSVFDHMTAWMKSLPLDEPAVLVGHSLGGYLALAYALLSQRDVRALVLVDPFYTLDQLPLFLRARYRSPLLTAEVIDLTPEWVVRLVIDLTSLSIRNGFMMSKAARAQTAADYKRAAPGIFNIPHTIQNLGPRLPEITVPTLVIWGARDQTLAPRTFARLVEAIPGARSAVLDDGHVPHQTRPQEFNSVVLDFLKGL